LGLLFGSANAIAQGFSQYRGDDSDNRFSPGYLPDSDHQDKYGNYGWIGTGAVCLAPNQGQPVAWSWRHYNSCAGFDAGLDEGRSYYDPLEGWYISGDGEGHRAIGGASQWRFIGRKGCGGDLEILIDSAYGCTGP